MRNEITIEIETNSTTHAYEPLDLSRDTTISFEFLSNLMSSIDSITCSSSYTLKVPHTLNNDRILDLAKVPSYDSKQRYRKIGCRVYVNGIDMIGDAWCYITDSDKDSYSLVFAFGLMQHFGTWLNNKPGLRDLQYHPDDKIKWCEASANNLSDDPIWLAGVSHCFPSSGNPYPAAGSLFYGVYDCGVDNKKLCNIHPFVTLREIWERIVSENNLSFSLPQSVRYDMENMALVLTKNNNVSIAMDTEQISCIGKPLTIGKATDLKRKWFFRMKSTFEDYFNNTESCFIHKGEGVVEITIDTIYLRCTKSGGFQSIFETDIINNPNDYRLIISSLDENNQVVRITPQATYTGAVKYVVNRTFTINQAAIENGWPILDLYIESKKLPSFPDDVWEHPWSTPPSNPTWSGGLDAYLQISTNAQFTSQDNFALYSYQHGTTTKYPNTDFELVKNLPDISQIEFIKTICQIYGLFPVVNSDNHEQIDFIPFVTIYDNITNGKSLDWSEKHVETGKPNAEKTTFTLNDYAQRNSFGYKDDEKEAFPHNSVAYLEVDNELLEKTKNLVEFPWAASDGNKITQYEMSDDNLSVKFVECEYRLMRVIDWMEDTGEIVLNFSNNIEAQSLFNAHYLRYQETVRKPLIITDRVLLHEYDLKDLDFTKPVYLDKYGRYFAIISVRWSSASMASEAKLLTL